MGDAAEMMLDGILDSNGEYNPSRNVYYGTNRKSNEFKQFLKIKKELKNLIKQKTSLCTTEKERNNAVNIARSEINRKYGHEWRNLSYL